MNHPTINVRDLVINVNDRIRKEPDINARRALCSFLEGLLRKSKLYAGFCYVYESGHTVSPDEIQAAGWEDDYRRAYYLHSRIQRFDGSTRSIDAPTS